MSDLVGNPEDRFSRVAAQILESVTVECESYVEMAIKSGKHVRVMYTPSNPTFI